MPLFESVYFGNRLDDWFISAGIFVVMLFILSLLKRTVVGRFRDAAEATATEFDDLLIEIVAKTRLFFLSAISAYAGSLLLTLSAGVAKIVETIVVLAVLVQAALWGNEIISFLINRSIKAKLSHDASSATTLSGLRFLSKLVLWSVILLLALDNVGIDITALVAGLGVGGIAVALAVQSILGDLFASLSIVLDKPFVIGDFIIVNEYLGTVEHIGLKTTRIRSLSGEQIIFANADLLNSRIRNFKRMFERRVMFSIGVTYQTPAEKLAIIPSLIRGIIEQQPQTRFDRSHFKEYGDSALIFETVYYVLNSDYNVYMNIQQEINLLIYRRFREEGIEFAYPTRTVFLQQNPIGEVQSTALNGTQ